MWPMLIVYIADTQKKSSGLPILITWAVSKPQNTEEFELIGTRSLFTVYRLDSSPVLLNVVLITDKIVYNDYPQASEVVRLIWGSGVAKRTCIRWNYNAQNTFERNIDEGTKTKSNCKINHEVDYEVD